jgi:predicted DNA binding CopG/RHH family protein
MYQTTQTKPKKQNITISLSVPVVERFKKDCDNKCLKYSNRIEYLVKRYLNSLS